jgi:hypothetical protein
LALLILVVVGFLGLAVLAVFLALFFGNLPDLALVLDRMSF